MRWDFWIWFGGIKSKLDQTELIFLSKTRWCPNGESRQEQEQSSSGMFGMRKCCTSRPHTGVSIFHHVPTEPKEPVLENQFLNPIIYWIKMQPHPNLPTVDLSKALSPANERVINELQKIKNAWDLSPLLPHNFHFLLSRTRIP